MFGLTLEKLFLVALLAGIVIGPRRLPGYARHLAGTVRALRHLVDKARDDAEREMGISLRHTEWQSLDLRRYDPRAIVHDALREPAAPSPAAPPASTATDETIARARHVRPGRKYVVAGTVAHPRRIPVESLPHDDPRRVAAETHDDPPATAPCGDGESTDDTGPAPPGSGSRGSLPIGAAPRETTTRTRAHRSETGADVGGEAAR